LVKISEPVILLLIEGTGDKLDEGYELTFDQLTFDQMTYDQMTLCKISFEGNLKVYVCPKPNGK
jgi:hypothetical protein